MATPRRRNQPQRGYKATRDTVLEAARWYLGTWMPSGSDRGATVDRQPPPQSDSGEGGVLYEAGNAARVANAGGRGEIIRPSLWEEAADKQYQAELWPHYLSFTLFRWNSFRTGHSGEGCVGRCGERGIEC